MTLPEIAVARFKGDVHAELFFVHVGLMSLMLVVLARG